MTFLDIRPNRLPPEIIHTCETRNISVKTLIQGNSQAARASRFSAIQTMIKHNYPFTEIAEYFHLDASAIYAFAAQQRAIQAHEIETQKRNKDLKELYR